LRGLLLSEGRKGGGEKEKGKVKGREGETRWMEGFGPPKRGDPYARPLAGFKRAAPQWRGEGMEGRGTEREKRGRKEEKGREGKLEQGHRLAKAGPV